MIQVNLFVGSRYPVDRKQIRQTVARVLQEYGVKEAQVDISIVGKRKIKQLNETKLKHRGTTDVLSFPQHDRGQLKDFPLPANVPPHLGDIVISYPAALENARRFGKLVDKQISFFVEHALLHLLGYHHDD